MSGSKSPPSEDAASRDEPLALTIHSLPEPAPAARSDDGRARRGRWKMLLVLAVCAAPVLASYLTYYDVIPMPGVRVYGELIEPQRPLPELPARAPGSQTVPLTALRGQWLLISVAGGACDAKCESNLYFQRQLREMLGKSRDRLDWVWLVDDGIPVRAGLKTGVATATVLQVDGAELRKWLAPAAGQALSDHLYLVDPQGHWMMRFPAGMDKGQAAKAKRDLDRLMRASAGWDLPGRPTGEGRTP